MREIKHEEKELIRRLSNAKYVIPKFVRDLDDGQMGSISFDLNGTGKRQNQIVKAEYIDSDGVQVILELTTDEDDNLFELDVWKVDFSPLKTYPSFEKLNLKSTKHGL